ncbi:MAG: sugar phosphate nucleotidyltransferase [Opitutales bacterium]|nr:sugar phosphate nucleotidyltransferase [Opitutales bacterium]
MTTESTSLSLLVLAAGLGSRYGGLKQLEPIGPSGETLMDYSIFDAKRAGFTRVVFLIRREMQEIFEEQVGAKYSGILKVDYAFQEKDDLPGEFVCPEERSRPWGTGHAVWAARKLLKNDLFAVINADDFYGAETFEVLANTLTAGKDDFSMVGFCLSDTLSDHGLVSRGVCKVSYGLLESVEEWSKIGGNPLAGLNAKGEPLPLQGNEIVSMNVWGFPPSVFPLLEERFCEFLKGVADPLTSEFYLPAAVDDGIRMKIARVHVNQATCSWMGVTYKEDKPLVVEAVQDLVNQSIYPSKLFG